MGRKNKEYSKDLHQQAYDRLTSMLAFGESKTDAKIREAFAKKIPGTTKLIIAQRISSVQYADRIIVMESGTINGIGTHEELLKTNEIYKEVYTSQNKVGDEDEK